LGPHEARERVPTLRGQPQAEAACHLGVDAALSQVLLCPVAGGLPELVHVEAPRELHRPEEVLAAVVARGAALLGERHARLLGEGAHRLGDRKSTRLNSSHDQISYAVFCLKKKKTSRMEVTARMI